MSFSVMNRAKLSALRYAAGGREDGLSSRFSRWKRVCIYLCCVCWCAVALVKGWTQTFKIFGKIPGKWGLSHLQTMPRETERRTTKRSRTTLITVYLGHPPACSESVPIWKSSSRLLETIVSTRNTEQLVESSLFLRRRMQKSLCKILNYWTLWVSEPKKMLRKMQLWWQGKKSCNSSRFAGWRVFWALLQGWHPGRGTSNFFVPLWLKKFGLLCVCGFIHLSCALFSAPCANLNSS